MGVAQEEREDCLCSVPIVADGESFGREFGKDGVGGICD